MAKRRAARPTVQKSLMQELATINAKYSKSTKQMESEKKRSERKLFAYVHQQLKDIETMLQHPLLNSNDWEVASIVKAINTAAFDLHDYLCDKS